MVDRVDNVVESVENNVSLDDHTKNGENVVELSVEEGDSDNVGGGLGTDRLGDETGSEIENGVNEGEEDGEIRSCENGGSDVSVRVLVVKENSDREINVDEVKEGSDREPNLDEVKEGSDREPNLDEVKEGSDREPNLGEDSGREANLDEVREGSDRDPTLNLNGVKDDGYREPNLVEVREGSDREPNLDEVREGSGREANLNLEEVSEDSGREANLKEVSEDSGREPNLEEVKEGSGREATLNLNGVNEDGYRESNLDEVREGSGRELNLDEVREASGREPTPKLDEVKGGSDREANLDEVREGSGREANLDEVREGSGQEPSLNLNEVKQGSDREPKLEEVKESSVLEHVIDGVKESGNPKPVVGEIKEAELGFEASDSGNVSVDGIGSRSSDVDANSKGSVSDVHESALVETEDITAVSTIPDGAESSEIKDVELGLENKDNVDASVDGVGSHSSDVEGNNKDSGCDVPEFASVETENIIAVNGFYDLSKPSEAKEVDVCFETSNLGIGSLSSDANNNHKDGVSDTQESAELGTEVSSPVTSVPDVPEAFELGVDTSNNGIVSGDGIGSHSLGVSHAQEFAEMATEDFPAGISAPDATEPSVIKEVELHVENNDNNNVSSDDIGSPLLNVDNNSKDNVSDAQESAEVTTEDIIVVNRVPDVPEPSETDVQIDTATAEVHEGELQTNQQIVSPLENEVVTASAKIVDEREVVYDVSSVADNSPRGSADDICSLTETVNSEINAAVKSTNLSDGTLRPNISFGSFGSTSPLSRTDINLRSDALNKSTPVSMISSKTKLYSTNGGTLLNSHTNGDHFSGLDRDTTACVEVTQPEQTNELSVAPVKGSDAQNNNPDLARGPVYWLIKIPKGDEGKYRELLRESEMELAEKTKTRNAFQAEFTKHQAYCRELRSTLEAAKLEARAALDLMRAKKREVDSCQYLINLARRAVTVEDVDNQRLNLEHTLQHETHTLRAERDLVREIRQLNNQHQQLSADPQRLQEVQQALNQRDQTGEQLKVLKKELDALRDNFSKADEQVRAAQKKHEDEIDLLNDLKHKVITANDIRQEAYARAIMLKKQQYQKSVPFYQAKNDLRVAYNFAAAGNKDSLERHCSNQVEKIMEMWNKNDEFRKEYIECNKGRIFWKFRTLDGTQLGINEVPPSMEDISGNRVRISAQINSPTAIPAHINSPTVVLPVQKELPVEAKIAEDKITVKKNEDILKNSVAIVSRSVEIEEDKEEPKPTKEEEELMRKAEQLRREEEAARLREQRKLEEKAKAEEALERKRRNALKAQARAEFKARKEAEEKERRAKKKQMKGINVNTTEIETAQPSEPSSESGNEPEVAEKPATVGKRLKNASFHTKQIKTAKSIPPALRNKGKKGLLRYWPYACVVLLAIGLLYLGSFERIQAIMQLISGLLHR